MSFIRQQRDKETRRLTLRLPTRDLDPLPILVIKKREVIVGMREPNSVWQERIPCNRMGTMGARSQCTGPGDIGGCYSHEGH